MGLAGSTRRGKSNHVRLSHRD